ncbi:helix-turn-helix domain-containing protein, partial [Streptomyces sp. NPDC001193]
MSATVNPTVSRRRLGSELRRLREISGMTTQQVTERLLISQPKISLLENGRRVIKPRDVRDSRSGTSARSRRSCTGCPATG